MVCFVVLIYVLFVCCVDVVFMLLVADRCPITTTVAVGSRLPPPVLPHTCVVDVVGVGSFCFVLIVNG